MSLFYFDDTLKACESMQNWESALNYLQTIYRTEKKSDILNSLVGFSWFYFLESMTHIRKDKSVPCESYLLIWKKYLGEGFKDFYSNPSFNFIAGYTISLHGFFICHEHEKKGLSLIKRCFELSDDKDLKSICERFIENTKVHKSANCYKRAIDVRGLFDGDSLLDKYFCEVINYKIR